MGADHPNTTATGVYGGLGALAVYLLNKYAGTHLNAVEGAGIASGAAAVRLFIGRRGIKGTLTAFWRGSDVPAKKAAK